MDAGGETLIELPPQGLTKATNDHVTRSIQWLLPSSHNIEPGGSGNPLPALRRALGYKPDLIFLLSDNITGQGIYAINQQKLLNEIERANTGAAKINTMQFIYPDPLALQGGRGTLERIAEQTGGLYSFISRERLNLR